MASDNRNESSDDVVILVHGTYAASKSDQGKAWWQSGSAASEGLNERLPEGVRVAANGEVFHWSGENSERARIKGAKDLLQHLVQLEQSGRRYHLVGHSHGGSVIWHMLRMATWQKKTLQSLRSWTTVGTPFLHHKTNSLANVATWFNLMLAAIFFKPICAVIYRMGDFMCGGIEPLTYAAERDLEHPSLYEQPMLYLMRLIGQPIHFSDNGNGICIGTFDSSRGDSALQFLFCNPEGWLLLFVALLVIFIYFNLAIAFIRPVLESVASLTENRTARSSRDAFRTRWLGLWSVEDEAVNGLRATLDISIKIVSRMAPRDRVLFSDKLEIFSAPYYWIVAPIFNALVRPVLDRMIRFYLVKSAQGNNRPSSEVIQVSCSPWDPKGLGISPSLPKWLDARIIDAANESARGTAPKLRRLLALPSFVTGLEQLGHSITGKELVHTSYFDHPETLDLIAMHISWANGVSDWTSACSTHEESLVTWLQEAKACVGVDLDAPPMPDNRQRASRHLLAGLRQLLRQRAA
jgi:hypothetical protein